MKAKQIAITSGAACGTLVTEVRADNDELLGYIRVVNIEFPILGMGTYFISKQCNSRLGYNIAIFHRLVEAYEHLSVTLKELDESYLGDYPYDEKVPRSYYSPKLK